MPAAGSTGPAGPGTLAARRAAVFGRPQPVLFAEAGAGELRLRPMEEQDLDAVVQTCRDPETVRWTTVPDPYERADAQGYQAYGRDAWARGDAACFVIADADDRYAGTLDLRLSPADPLLADVGFMTAPAARGRGYMPAALVALSAWGFSDAGPGPDRVEGERGQHRLPPGGGEGGLPGRGNGPGRGAAPGRAGGRLGRRRCSRRT